MKKNTIFFMITFLITTLIIFSWFSTRTIVSNNSEENLDFVNFARTASHYSTSWYPSGTGTLNIFEFVRFPFLKFLSYFHAIGFESYQIQAISYWIIMNIGIISMYFLLYKGLYLDWFESVVGSYFYLLNIYSMTQVWKRNIYQGMFPWGYLPLFTFLWMKWLENGKFMWLILFGISISIFSHAFAHPGYFFVYITVSLLYLLIRIKQNWSNLILRRLFFLRAIIAFVFAILLNIWWIYPLVHKTSVRGSTLDVIKNEWKANLDSVIGVSKYFDSVNIIFLRQKNYFEHGSPLSTEWFSFYSSPGSIVISALILLIVIIGINKSKTKNFYKYLLSLLVIGWFISKGTNFPFGMLFYKFLFSNIPLTAALRNPYEKFGLVFLLPYAVFFAIGINAIYKKYKGAKSFILKFLTLFIFLGVLVYPMWNGDIFPSRHRLNIPDDYFYANEYLNSRLSSRVFHIPFSIQTEKLEYNWGYIGEDPSENLFDSQNVSRSDVAVYNKYYKLLPKFLNYEYFPRSIGLLGVDHILVHKDIVYPSLDTNIVKIDKWRQVSKIQEFSNLDIYTLDEKIIKPEIYSSVSIIKFDSMYQALLEINEGTFDTDKNIFTLKEEDIPIFKNKENLLPNINFIKVSTNKYRVTIKNIKNPFILVLNETFNHFWQAKVGDKEILNHFEVNGFANAWLIENQQDQLIEIVFKIWPWE